MSFSSRDKEEEEEDDCSPASVDHHPLCIPQTPIKLTFTHDSSFASQTPVPFTLPTPDSISSPALPPAVLPDCATPQQQPASHVHTFKPPPLKLVSNRLKEQLPSALVTPHPLRPTPEPANLEFEPSSPLTPHPSMTKYVPYINQLRGTTRSRKPCLHTPTPSYSSPCPKPVFTSIPKLEIDSLSSAENSDTPSRRYSWLHERISQ